MSELPHDDSSRDLGDESGREARIRERAHHLWEQSDRTDGFADDHWRQAEAEIDAEDQLAGVMPGGTTTSIPGAVAGADLGPVDAGDRLGGDDADHAVTAELPPVGDSDLLPGESTDAGSDPAQRSRRRRPVNA